MRVQESVFELTLKDDAQFNRLWPGVESKIATGDSVRAYPIHQNAVAGVRCLGSPKPENPAYATVL